MKTTTTTSIVGTHYFEGKTFVVEKKTVHLYFYYEIQNTASFFYPCDYANMNDFARFIGLNENIELTAVVPSDNFKVRILHTTELLDNPTQ